MFTPPNKQSTPLARPFQASKKTPPPLSRGRISSLEEPSSSLKEPVRTPLVSRAPFSWRKWSGFAVFCAVVGGGYLGGGLEALLWMGVGGVLRWGWEKSSRCA